MSTDGDDPAGGPVWTAGQVARHLRIAESTLRSWHRRYGLGPHAARPGQYRRYGAEDIARLQRMHDLIRSGMLPAEAARTVSTTTRRPRPLDEALTEVLAAARNLDSPRCLATLERAVTESGVLRVWERLCRPALAAVDADQVVDPDRIDCEHVLSWAIAAALHRVDQPPAVSARPKVMLACTDAEQHTLALEALAAALTERQTPVRMLGAAVPAATLVRAVTAARPAAVVLWAQRSRTARLDAVRALDRFPVRRLVAGPGWPPPPSGVERATSLAEAVRLLTTGAATTAGVR